MAGSGRVIGWQLAPAECARLLDLFPPRYATVIADHVTLDNQAAGEPLPRPAGIRIVGHADDGHSLEALVVTIDGTTDRPDGSTFHITWSLAPGRAARESNDVLRERGWQPLEPCVPVTAQPARF